MNATFNKSAHMDVVVVTLRIQISDRVSTQSSYESNPHDPLAGSKHR